MVCRPKIAYGSLTQIRIIIVDTIDLFTVWIDCGRNICLVATHIKQRPVNYPLIMALEHKCALIFLIFLCRFKIHRYLWIQSIYSLFGSIVDVIFVWLLHILSKDQSITL